MENIQEINLLKTKEPKTWKVRAMENSNDKSQSFLASFLGIIILDIFHL
jgi:hypothetical protein